MRLTSFIFLSGILALICHSCDYISSINQEGPVISKTIDLQPLTNLVVEAPYQITIHQSDENKAIVEGMDYLVNEIDIVQSGDTLLLRHHAAYNIQKSKVLKLDLYTGNLKSVTSNAPGTLLTADTLHVPELSIVVNGSGMFFETNITIDVNDFSLYVYGMVNSGTHHLAGKANKAYFQMEGCTYTYADKLQTRETDFINKSSANAFVNADSALNVTIYSGGNLYYLGNPALNVTREYLPYFDPTGKVMPY
jgi:hypothetical protein